MTILISTLLGRELPILSLQILWLKTMAIQALVMGRIIYLLSISQLIPSLIAKSVLVQAYR